MTKCSDREILKKLNKHEKKQGNNFSSFSEFRKQYFDYQRTKKPKDLDRKLICQPYNESFYVPKKENQG